MDSEKLSTWNTSLRRSSSACSQRFLINSGFRLYPKSMLYDGPIGSIKKGDYFVVLGRFRNTAAKKMSADMMVTRPYNFLED